MENIFGYDPVEYDVSGKCLRIIDQTLLPLKESFVCIYNEEDLIDAIKTLKVRGAPAIGIAAAIGVAVVMDKYEANDLISFQMEFQNVMGRVLKSRPTAMNLGNALQRLSGLLSESLSGNTTIPDLKKILLEEALKIKDEDIEANISMAHNALTLLRDGATILTYCNAGHLAVSRYGPALSPIYLAQQKGMRMKVYACETRPLLQGARLTTYELTKAGIDVTLVCDNMVASLMACGKIDAVVTGCDRIALNGDTANKIGTLTLSVCAKHYGIPHYIIGPETTIDKECEDGSGIIIEQRPSYEVTTMWYKQRLVPENLSVFNPAFDVTPSHLIEAIITENGIYRYPYNFK